MAPSGRQRFTVLDLLQLDLKENDALDLRCIGGRPGLVREIEVSEINRPGLELAGFYENFAWQRIQIFGRGENAFLQRLAGEGRRENLESLFTYRIPCCVFTHAQQPTADFAALAEKAECPVLQTHALLLRVHHADPPGALHDLRPPAVGARHPRRGLRHRRPHPGRLRGRQERDRPRAHRARPPPRRRRRRGDPLRQRLHPHGPGRQQGHQATTWRSAASASSTSPTSSAWAPSATRSRSSSSAASRNGTPNKILRPHRHRGEHDRDPRRTRAQLEIPVKPGRNIPIIIETAAMNERLKKMGYHSAKEFNQNVLRWLESENARAVFPGREVRDA